MKRLVACLLMIQDLTVLCKAMFTPTDPFNSERVMVAALEADLDDIDFTPNPENTDGNAFFLSFQNLAN